MRGLDRLGQPAPAIPIRPTRARKARAASASVACVGIVAIGVALAGCGHGDPLLARVGAETITARDVRSAAIRNGNAATGDLRATFDALVTRALLLEASKDLHRIGVLAPSDSLPAKGSPRRTPALERRMLDEVYRIEVLNRVPEPDSTALRVEWNRRPRSKELSAAVVAVITVPDSGAATELGAALRGGRSLSAAGLLLSPPRRPDVLSLRFPADDSLWRRLEPALATLSPHQIRPFRTEHGWAFVELLDRKLRWEFDAVSPAEITSLRDNLLRRGREARLGAVVESLTAVIPVRVLDARLERDLRMPEETSPALPLAVASLVLALIIGCALRLAPRRGGKEPVGLGAFGRIILQVGLVGVLIFLGAGYLFRADGGWDFANYHRAAQEMRAGMSPYDPATVARDKWDPQTPFLYAPVTLWLFGPLGGLPLEKAEVVWFWIKIGVALALGVLSWRLLSGRCPAPLMVGMLLYGFNGAMLLDLRAGNVATIEVLLIWSALIAFLSGRRWLCAALIAIAAQFKLLPIVFLSLLIWPTRTRSARTGPILLGLGLCGLMLALPKIAGMPWASGYLGNLETVRPYGEVNPSALGLVDMVLDRGNLHPGHNRVAPLIWLLYCVALLIVSVGGLRRAWRAREPLEWIIVTAMLFILLSPRPIVYGYSLVIVPALLIVMRLWPGLLGTSVAVGALAAQGLIQRGLLRSDFIPGSLPWPVLVVVANLPFLMTLGLWIAFIRSGTSADDALEARPVDHRYRVFTDPHERGNVGVAPQHSVSSWIQIGLAPGRIEHSSTGVPHRFVAVTHSSQFVHATFARSRPTAPLVERHASIPTKRISTNASLVRHHPVGRGIECTSPTPILIVTGVDDGP
ncbi:MAG TPA: glycosyltransferase 87 family protein [Candidatus Saccharimonadaceae bacterium]|nr:glycosyltransferase 87 family protein [Candidatus Saccharimonadaceae bacterium]